jgi:hypothetical protein
MASNIVKSEAQIQDDLKKKLFSDLHEFIVCIICEAVPKEGAIYNCDSCGHAICSACFSRSNRCTCNAVIKHRNKGLEKVRTVLPTSCKFRKNGCDAILKLESLIAHEVVCQWRSICCPNLTCRSNKQRGAKIIFNRLENHLTEHHTALANQLNESFIDEICPGIMEECLLGPRPTTYWAATKISVNGAQFFHEMILKNKRFHIWVYYHGAKTEANNYNCHIKVYGGDNEEYCYNGPPRSLDESVEEIIAARSGLVLCTRQAKRIISEEAMNYSVKISCLNEGVEEAMEEDVTIIGEYMRVLTENDAA